MLAAPGARRRVALARGLAAAALVAVVGYDLAQLAATRASGLPLAVGLTAGIVVAVCAPLLIRTIGQLALERDAARRLADELAVAREAAASAQQQVVRAATVAAPTSLHRLGAGLLRLRHELGIHQRRLTAAASSGTLWSYAEQLPSDEQWQAARDTISTGALADAGLYTVLADAYAEAARVARGNALRLLAGLPSTVTPADRLGDALVAVNTACAYLDDLLGVVAETVAIPVRTPAATPAGAGAEAALVDVSEARPVSA